MELPKIKKSEHGMLEGIKSKLGFADANPHYDDGYYDEGFDDYSEEYGEYGPDYNEDDFPADDAPGSRYEPLCARDFASCARLARALLGAQLVRGIREARVHRRRARAPPRCPRASTAIRCRLAV